MERLGFTHFWIAAAATSSAAGSLITFSEGNTLDSNDWLLALMIGACTGWVYTFQRWMKRIRNPEQMPIHRLNFMRKHGGRLGVFWTVLAILSFFYWVFNPETTVFIDNGKHWILILLSAILGIGYAFNPFGKGWRERPHLKLPAIALSWTIATVIFPAAQCGLNWNGSEGIYCLGIATSQILFVAGITVPFDVRDLHFDPVEFIAVLRAHATIFGCLDSRIAGFTGSWIHT